jgi:hypothetical protein
MQALFMQYIPTYSQHAPMQLLRLFTDAIGASIGKSLLVATALLAGHALAEAAQPTATQASAVAPSSVGAARQIKGFRSAHFSMDEVAVRQAIAKDFPHAAKPTVVSHPKQPNHVLVLALPSLEPGPGPANVVYIFDQSSKRLIHVSVQWRTSDNPTQDERDKIGVSAAQLSNFLQNHNWQDASVITGAPTGPHSTLLFAAVDKQGATLELTVEGVSTFLNEAAPPVRSPQGPAWLKVNYSSRGLPNKP